MKIGDTVWVYDANYRVYRDPLPGETYSRGGPIWRQHWRPQRIVSETSRSWVTNRDLKVPKKGLASGVCSSEDELDRLVYINEHAYKIGDAVGRIRDYEMLRGVAALIGYSTENK